MLNRGTEFKGRGTFTCIPSSQAISIVFKNPFQEILVGDTFILGVVSIKRFEHYIVFIIVVGGSILHFEVPQAIFAFLVEVAKSCEVADGLFHIFEISLFFCGHFTDA